MSKRHGSDSLRGGFMENFLKIKCVPDQGLLKSEREQGESKI